jgi:CDP-glucose 4,6-dehydratase
VSGTGTPFADFYRDRRVLVTGHGGFKGRWLCAWLSQLQADVRGFGRTAPDTRSVVPTCSGDIRDPDALLRALRWAEPEVVFHLAAESNVLRSYRTPAATFEVNVMGTVRLLDACSAVDSVRAVVVVTSDKCYAEGRGPHTEDDPLGGADPYSASKAGAELVAGAWRSITRRPRLATARAGNVIGGGDWSADRIVVDLARAAQDGTRAVLRYPHAVRPWQHVLEPLGGYLGLGARLAVDGSPFERAWNFGPDPRTARTVADLATEFARRWAHHAGRPADPPVVDGAAGPPERVSLTLDSSAARAYLGWRPVLSFGEAVDLTAEWYARSATERDFDAGAVTAEQIECYQARVGRPAEAMSAV